MYKAIFLDVDGVLVDSEKVFNLCWRKAAEQSGYSMTVEQALQLRSLDSQLAKEQFSKWYGDENAYPRIRAIRKDLMSEQKMRDEIVAKPGVLEFLEDLRKLQIMVSIVTSSPISRITDYLTSVGIDTTLFDALISAEQVKRGKPFPDIYQYACEAIGFEPSECIAVEDSPNGTQSAHNAGCYTVMVPDLSPYTDELKQYVDLCCDKLSDVFIYLSHYVEE